MRNKFCFPSSDKTHAERRRLHLFQRADKKKKRVRTRSCLSRRRVIDIAIITRGRRKTRKREKRVEDRDDFEWHYARLPSDIRHYREEGRAEWQQLSDVNYLLAKS